MIDPTLFTVPAEFAAQFQLGTIRRVGALLKDSSTGQIVAHMRETGAATQVVSQMSGMTGSLLSNPLSPLGFGAQLVTVAQNEQIKHALGVLQSLQMANIVLSGVGIGVSLVGFAAMNVKINRLKTALDSVGAGVDRIAESVRQLREDHLDMRFAALRTACEQVDEAWILTDPERQWRDAAASLHELQNGFFTLALKTRERDGSTAPLFVLFVEAWLLVGSTRIAARLATNDVAAARQITRGIKTDIGRLTGDLDLFDLLPPEARLRAGSGDLPGRMELFQRFRPEAELRLVQLRDREDMVESKVLILRYLDDTGTNGRAYLEEARNEQREPLLFLPHRT